MVATLGPVGHWRWGPGTLASALVAILWWASPLAVWVWAAAVAVLFPLGIACSQRAETVLGHDDGRIVIDEALGMGIAVLATPATAGWSAAAFILFRILDIAKPPPVSRLQDVPGGWGVMLDDLAAGGLTAAVLGTAAWLGPW